MELAEINLYLGLTTGTITLLVYFFKLLRYLIKKLIRYIYITVREVQENDATNNSKSTTK